MMAQTSPFMDSFLVFKTFMAGNDISLNNLANNVPNFLIFIDLCKSNKMVSVYKIIIYFSPNNAQWI